jgi:hypothetical protein
MNCPVVNGAELLSIIKKLIEDVKLPVGLSSTTDQACTDLGGIFNSCTELAAKCKACALEEAISELKAKCNSGPLVALTACLATVSAQAALQVPTKSAPCLKAMEAANTYCQKVASDIGNAYVQNRSSLIQNCKDCGAKTKLKLASMSNILAGGLAVAALAQLGSNWLKKDDPNNNLTAQEEADCAATCKTYASDTTALNQCYCNDSKCKYMVGGDGPCKDILATPETTCEETYSSSDLTLTAAEKKLMVAQCKCQRLAEKTKTNLNTNPKTLKCELVKASETTPLPTTPAPTTVTTGPTKPDSTGTDLTKKDDITKAGLDPKATDSTGAAGAGTPGSSASGNSSATPSKGNSSDQFGGARINGLSSKGNNTGGSGLPNAAGMGAGYGENSLNGPNAQVSQSGKDQILDENSDDLLKVVKKYYSNANEAGRFAKPSSIEEQRIVARSKMAKQEVQTTESTSKKVKLNLNKKSKIKSKK